MKDLVLPLDLKVERHDDSSTSGHARKRCSLRCQCHSGRCPCRLFLLNKALSIWAKFSDTCDSLLSWVLTSTGLTPDQYSGESSSVVTVVSSSSFAAVLFSHFRLSYSPESRPKLRTTRSGIRSSQSERGDQGGGNLTTLMSEAFIPWRRRGPLRPARWAAYGSEIGTPLEVV